MIFFKLLLKFLLFISLKQFFLNFINKCLLSIFFSPSTSLDAINKFGFCAQGPCHLAIFMNMGCFTEFVQHFTRQHIVSTGVLWV